MTRQSNRLDQGGLIDRNRPIRFSFNGRALEGYAGDTLASAFLANDIHLIGRSFKYHRPRGILSAGAEEPNAWVQLEQGGFEEANVAATLAELYDGLNARSPNCWPNPSFDLGAINALLAPLLIAGFYYKTFMNPRRLWPSYERAIRQMAGVGKAPSVADAETYEEAHTKADVLVVGGGPSGLAAALVASRSGAKVVLAETGARFGGSLLSTHDSLDGAPATVWIANALAELQSNQSVRILKRTTIFGCYDHNYCVGLEKLSDHLPIGARTGKRQRLWQIRAGRVVVATGAHERPLVFANNDRPGVMLASAAQSYVNRYAVRPGRRAVVFTNNDSACRVALDLSRVGVEVAAVVDVREAAAGCRDELEAAGIAAITGSAIANVLGGKHVAAVDVEAIEPDGRKASGERRRIECDLVCMSGGWSPAVHLFSQSGGKLRYDADKACFVPGLDSQAVRVVGAANGAFHLGSCLAEGLEEGRAAAAAAGFDSSASALPRVEPARPETLILPVWSAAAPTAKQRKSSFVDFFGDVTLSGIGVAVREGYVSVEHLKRYTTTGMGLDQGKTGNLNALAILAEQTGSAIPEVGTTTYRPPYTPVTFGALAGGRTGALYKPLRRTAIDRWHEENGAVFEDFGLWRRPQHYAKAGLSMAEAVMGEARNVRDNVGIVDVSTLGKIHLHGPDVGELLNRVYTNRWDSLKVGRCRYGIMLKEDGMVFDDGVTARLGELDYHMTTTTGGAPGVFSWLHDLLQNDWPELRVHMASVTTQWAAVAVAGPNARSLMAKLSDDIDFAQEAFPFMSVRRGTVAGLAARVFSISFTGESSFEINVPARYGHALWTAIMAAGDDLGLAPFGVEAMDWLRIEKGHFIVGRDTDGTVTPPDLGLQSFVNESKGDFLGKRSLSLADLVRPDRPQLVGLRSDDETTVLPEGGQIIEALRPERPLPREGHVTSSCLSPAAGTPIALGLLNGGRGRIGERLEVYSEGKAYSVTVTDPHFFDPSGDRLRL